MERLDRGQAGFKVNRSGMDVFTLNELVQGRLRENKHICVMCRRHTRLYGVMDCG